MSAACRDTTPREVGADRTHEFHPGATHWPVDLSRRNFLQLMGASLALSGLNACTRRPVDKIISYVTPPEKTPTTDAAWYATAMPWQGFARGILAKSVQGRPIKLEGNPDHPESFGTTDAVTQAAILGLYDPDRSTTPWCNGVVSSWNEFAAEWAPQRAKFQRSSGAGFALVMEPTTSPTLLREIRTLLNRWPQAQWYQHTPLARFDRDGEQRDFDFSRADVVLALGGDPLFSHPSALRYARGFSQRRRIHEGEMNRNLLFALEPTLSLTGAQADLRLGLDPLRLPALLNALAQNLNLEPARPGNLSALESHFVDSLVAELREGKKVAVCVVGEEMPPEIQQWADRFNLRFSRASVDRRSAQRSDGDKLCRGGLAELSAAIDRGEVASLALLGINPVYSASGDADFSAAVKRVGFAFHAGEYVDETAAVCRWHLPESHFLETWGDLRAFSGTATILQPLISPMHASRSVAEIVRLIRAEEIISAYELVRETWQRKPNDDFESRWHDWLNRGVISDDLELETNPPVDQNATPQNFPELTGTLPAKPENEVTILFRPDSNVLDGRWSNNAWLQELPRPFSALVWENAALVSSELAGEQHWTNGDVIELSIDGRKLEAPIWILPGQARNCVTLPLGYGRTRGGSAAVGAGFSAFILRTHEQRWQRSAVAFRATGKHHALISTQGHFSMEGREPVRARTLSRLHAEEAERPDTASFFPSWPKTGYAWGMSIDLSTCYGCNACVVACQAENNIPVVGREQVGRGREMHWIRIDRYFSGAEENLRVLHQPVPCMHCEQAPCEVVCPVGATVHSSEGLNDMVYNRCVGTRYCSNNCPYKVRRFNFLDYHAPRGAEVFQQSNPDVTVRERGVMEKCTYCVQRINAGRIAAEKENRRVRDGEIRTACQQACPVNAIVFGDLNDPASQVVQRKKEQSSYALLGELNTRPRTTYLAKIEAEKFSPAPAGVEQ